MNSYEIQVMWDEEASVYVAISDDVPGLSIQADTFEELRREVDELLPHLLEANAQSAGDNIKDIPVRLIQDCLISHEQRV